MDLLTTFGARPQFIKAASLSRVLGAMLVGIERAPQQAKPDWVLVCGDTNSTLAGGLAASKGHVFFHHVPCVALRQETEWVELVELGANRLCPTDSPQLLCQVLLEA